MLLISPGMQLYFAQPSYIYLYTIQTIIVLVLCCTICTIWIHGLNTFIWNAIVFRPTKLYICLYTNMQYNIVQSLYCAIPWIIPYIPQLYSKKNYTKLDWTGLNTTRDFLVQIPHSTMPFYTIQLALLITWIVCQGL